MDTRIAFLRWHARVERCRPATVDDLDVRCWVDPGLHRPQHFLDVRGIDVVIDDDGVTAVARRGRTPEHGMRRLLGMTDVALLDRHHHQVIVVDVDTGNIGHTRRLELIPQHARIEPHAVMRGTRPLRRHADDDRIVAVIDRLDPNHRLILAGAQRAARVVARPLTERPFLMVLL